MLFTDVTANLFGPPYSPPFSPNGFPVLPSDFFVKKIGGVNMKKELSRRDFMKSAAGVAVGAAAMGVLGACQTSSGETTTAGVSTDAATTAAATAASSESQLDVTPVPQGGWSWETAPDPIPDSEIKETIEADIVIVGAGIAGVTASLRASELGADVAVVEKASWPSSRGGHYAAYQTNAMTAAGMTNDPKDEIAADWMRMSGNRCDQKLVYLFLDRSSEVMNWLDDMSGDALNIIPIQTHYVGKYYYEHIGTHVIRGSFDDNEHGVSAPVFFMWKKAEENGVKFYFDSAAEQLVKDGERVSAVIVKDADGYKKYVGKKAIILATGDISGDDEMMQAYGGELANIVPVKAYIPVGMNTGDGQKMGMWAGGHMEMSPSAPMIHLIRYCGLCFGFLYVNQQGNRFMNEDTWIQAKSIQILKQPGGNEYAFSIFDSNWKEDVAKQIPLAGGQFWDNMSRLAGEDWTPESAEKIIAGALENGTAFQADSLEELADKMGVDRANFLASVENYNAMYEQGEDTEFHKRAELLSPIKDGPFYALKFGPSLLVTMGGLEINDKLQVVDDNKEAIPGLYAIGNVSGGRYGVDYPVTINGNSHGSAMTWGYVAAENIMNS